MPVTFDKGSSIRLSDEVCMELSTLHGNPERARAHRERKTLPAKPASGEGLQERVLVMNDLHLGIGKDPDTGRLFAGDDFGPEQEMQFKGLMEKEWARSAGEDGALKNKLRLVLNGDVVDFLQTSTERPHLRYPDGYAYGGRAPKNTPANAVIMLNMIREGHPQVFKTLAEHLRQGHLLDIIPGNHDRHLYNQHVWDGVAVPAGRTEAVGGFLPILKEELEKLGCDSEEVEASIGRVRRRPFAIYGDTFVDHGNMSDAYNRISRPYGELFADGETGLHEDMEQALGDWGVKLGFNQIEVHVPCLDNLVNGSKKFWWHAFTGHKRAAMKLVSAFAEASTKDGYEIGKSSPKLRMEQRINDMRAMVEKYPDLVESMNAMRPEAEKLSAKEAADGLVEIEKQSSPPFFDNFFKGEHFLIRLGRFFAGKVKVDKVEAGLTRRAAAGNEFLGLSNFMNGHTHFGRQIKALNTRTETAFFNWNTASWMSRCNDTFDATGEIYGKDSRLVGIIELGVDASGKPWSQTGIERLAKGGTELIDATYFDIPEVNAHETRMLTREIYAHSHPELVEHNRAGEITGYRPTLSSIKEEV